MSNNQKLTPEEKGDTAPYPKQGFVKVKMWHSKFNGQMEPSTEDEKNGDVYHHHHKDNSIRQAFIRNVLVIDSFQLLLITSIISLICFHEDVNVFVLANLIYVIPACFLAIVMIVILSCCDLDHPNNIILLGFVTLASGSVFGVVASLYEPETIVLGAVVTTVVTAGITAFAFIPNVEFTVWRGVALSFLMTFTILPIVYWGLRPLHIFTLTRTIIACMAAFVSSTLLMWDAHMIMQKDGNFSEENIPTLSTLQHLPKRNLSLIMPTQMEKYQTLTIKA